jgi:hypothetical protein
MAQESAETRDIFDGLFYQRDGSWYPLPGWVKFYLKLGFSLSQNKRLDTRFVVALAVPTRAYASLLIAAGIVYGKSQEKHKSIDHAHFEMLIALPDGSPVVLRDKKRKYKAKKCGVQTYNGKLLIGIQVDEGTTNTIKFIPAEDCEHVEIVSREPFRLPHSQKGHEITPPSLLVKALIGEIYVYDFFLHSCLEAVLIGPKNTLEEEMNAALATSKIDKFDCPGNLSDLIRVKEFQPPGTAFRSSILAAASRNNTSLTGDDTPCVIIFDGSHGFVKWRDYWRKFNWVVILDETDPNFNYAVSQVNQEFIAREEKQHKLKIPTIPPGIEIMYFNARL